MHVLNAHGGMLIWTWLCLDLNQTERFENVIYISEGSSVTVFPITKSPGNSVYIMAVLLSVFVSAYSFIHSFIPAISIAPLQVLYHSKALPTTARILYRSFMPKRYTKLNSLIYTSWSGPLQKSMVGYYGYGCAYYLYLALERGLSYCTVHEIYLYQKSMA